MSVSRSITIRVRSDTRERLTRLGRERGLTTPQLVDLLSRRAEEDQILAEHGNAIERVMADPAQAASYRAELSAWDAALGDGLDSA